MKKIFLIIFFAFSLTCASNILPVHGQTLQQEINAQAGALAGKQGAGYGQPGTGLIPVVARLIKIFLTFLGTLMVVYSVYGGFLIMTSRGEEDDITKGKGIIKNAVIGVTIILSSYGILGLTYRLLYSAQQNPFGSFFNHYTEQDTSRLHNPDKLEQNTVPFRAF